MVHTRLRKPLLLFKALLTPPQENSRLAGIRYDHFGNRQTGRFIPIPRYIMSILRVNTISRLKLLHYDCKKDKKDYISVTRIVLLQLRQAGSRPQILCRAFFRACEKSVNVLLFARVFLRSSTIYRFLILFLFFVRLFFHFRSIVSGCIVFFVFL